MSEGNRAIGHILKADDAISLVRQLILVDELDVLVSVLLEDDVTLLAVVESHLDQGHELLLAVVEYVLRHINVPS